jgi:MFS family permease
VECAVLTGIGRLPAAKVHPFLRLERLPQLIPGGYRGIRRGRLEWIQVVGIPGRPRARHEGLAMRQFMWLARSRPILLLLLAWGISYAGDMAAYTVASVYLYRAGGAGYVGLLGLEWALSAALLVPLVSSWSDRVRRERLLTATLIPRALLLGAAGAAMSGHGQAMLVAVLVALDGGLCSVFRPVQAALLPWLARTPGELTSANTAASVMQAAAMLVGPAIAAGLLSAGTARSAMFVTCGLVTAAAVLLAGVRPLAAQVPARTAKILKQVRLDIAAGFTACIRQRGALALVVPAAVQTFARGVLTVLTVVIALDLFGLGPAGVGLLGAALGAGGILGTPLALMLVRGKRVARCFAAGVAGWGVPMILLAFTHAGYWPYLLFGAIGVANLVDDVAVYSALQRVIPPRLMGRALGARRAVLLLSVGLGSAVAPPLIHAFGARATLAGVGLLLVVTAIVSVPSLRAIDSRLSAPGPEVALLRQVSFFGPLPFATVEHLASVLRPATYEPGDVIIREGDPGERFYLIAAGRARASSGGRQLSEMGAGDSFGEIALLRRIPRTATVTAISRLHARILDREEFLAAVTGSPESVESADAVISARLQVG